MESCLYVGPDLATVGVFTEPRLADTTERHRLPLNPPSLMTDPNPLSALAGRPDVTGVVIGMERGWPGSSHLRFAARVLRDNRRVWLHWPDESAVECLDRERIASYWRHWAVVTAFRVWRRLRSRGDEQQPVAQNAPPVLERCTAATAQLASEAQPVPFDSFDDASATNRIAGLGVYLRTDYWVSLTSGGSYGHTCYVAKELAASTDRMICFLANRYPLLDEYRVQQVVLPKASESSSELELLAATWHYYPILKVAFDALRPAYIYERLCLGNFTGALLSRELNIPYIVEYNGSEISMRRSFEGGGFTHERLFVQAEDVAFKQATMITVVSDVVKQSLVARGVGPDKILVNPNGADPDVYAPPSADARGAVRDDLGFGEDRRVIGFSGTFGGWHGIDVLAEAIPEICRRSPRAAFLLIGDGQHKPMLNAAIAKHGLDDRVRSVGRVPQSEGARLLAACDVYVSPHNSHMVDSKFFGSPTKLFEYMAMGRGIVASDLEQLGDVLSPALRLADLQQPDVSVTSQRAVLCTPGDVQEFVAAVVALADRPDLAEALGRNARQAVLGCYSWQRHVERIRRFLRDGRLQNVDAAAPAAGRERIVTGDEYKDEVQNQWDNNPVGTQYAKKTVPHTLDWYREIESHRYGEYAPWMPEVMEFDRHAGHDVLEIGGGVGTDLSQFARHGARVTDLDLSAGHLEHARENFALRGLQGRFVHHDGESMPFDDASFDVVYSNGVLHHTPNTRRVVQEIRRVLRPGGRAIVMMYAQSSLHYWGQLVYRLGLQQNLLRRYSMGEIMSRHVELTENDAKPLVKVYTAARLRQLFDGFEHRVICKRQLTKPELPRRLRFLPLGLAGRLMGWNLIIKATKPLA
jgi:glycosyltransferase involved in cell wall biosynthesis/ubiquinone/menaquinone biosynthesis C-methylase UbiE